MFSLFARLVAPGFCTRKKAQFCIFWPRSPHIRKNGHTFKISLYLICYASHFEKSYIEGCPAVANYLSIMMLALRLVPHTLPSLAEAGFHSARVPSNTVPNEEETFSCLPSTLEQASSPRLAAERDTLLPNLLDEANPTCPNALAHKIRNVHDKARPNAIKRGRDASFMLEDELGKRACTLPHAWNSGWKVGFAVTSEVRLFANDEAACSGDSLIDVTVRSRLDDGPALISHITADLIQGMARNTVTGLESALDVVRSFLPASFADKLHARDIMREEVACILRGVAAKLETMINYLHNRDSIRLLPGNLRIGKQGGPALRLLQQTICAALKPLSASM